MKSYLKQKSKGFSLIELIIAIIIVALLVAVVFAGGSAMIKSAKKSRAKSDLHNFDIALSSWIGENLKIINTSDNSGYSNVSSKLITKLNKEFPEDYKIKDVDPSEIPTFVSIEQANATDNYYIYQSERLDPWENPYYIILSNENRNGDTAEKKFREFFITVVSAGPNSQTAIDTTSSKIDNDDIFLLVQCTNGNLYSEIYDCSETQSLTNTENIASSYISLTAGLPVVRAYSSVFPTNDSSISDPFGGGGNVSPTPQPTPSTISFQIKLGAERTEIFDNVPENYTWNDFINESSIKLAYNTKVEDGKIVFTVNNIKYIIKNISASNTLVNNGIYVGEKQIEIASLSTVLTFSSPETFTVSTRNSKKNWDGVLEYSTDLANWTEWDGTTPINASTDTEHVLYIRGTDNSIITGNVSNSGWKLTGTNISCTGNIENLLDYKAGGHPEMANDCYSGMFSGCTSLTTVPELPATTLAEDCYYNMFSGCTSLTTVPELPATTLAEGCYGAMYSGCTSLTTAPELPVTTLADYCYASMFSGCTSLTTAPELPATTLADSCYNSMFSGCTSLTTTPELPAITLADYCYSNMFYGCTSLATAPELPAETLTNDCYYSMFEHCTNLTTASELPATTLADDCYYRMFCDCISLASAPELPATTLAYSCYYKMFSGCTNLTTVPTLSATTLADSCCKEMFSGCTSLTTAPELPVTTLATNCYNAMFANCTSLTTAPALPATTLAGYCYSNMFYGCESLTVLPALPATTLADDCYYQMFSRCYGINLSRTQTDNYQIPFKIPTNGIISDTSYSNSLRDMFLLTAGDFEFDGTPDINTTYYLWCEGHGTDADGDYKCDNCGQSLAGPETTALTFSSPEAFTLATANSTKNWDGTLEYSTDLKNWNTWDGTTALNSSDDAEHVLYVRGTGNARIAGNSSRKWVLAGSNISCTGNIENLLDYEVTAGNHPAMTNHAFAYMFYNCTSLTTAPELPATTLAEGCYSGMFYGCTSLTAAPVLPATTLANSCYYQMFSGCTNLTTAPELPATTLAGGCYSYMFYNCASLKISDTQTGEYAIPYRIPTTGEGTTATNALASMFASTGGTFTGTPNINTTYYLWCEGHGTDANHDNICDNCGQQLIGPASTAIKFSSDEAFVLTTENGNKNWDGTLEYSTDLSSWTTWDGTSISSSTTGTEKVLYIRGTGNTFITGNNPSDSQFGHWAFIQGTDISCTGNIENLLDYTVVAAGNHPSMNNYAFAFLFSDCTGLTTAPALPATTLAEGCYCLMFTGCTGLTTAPELPATTLAGSCYAGIFNGCTGLTAAPALPATTLTGSCYDSMFYGCTSLTTAPALPATTLANSCYSYMFSGCTNLTTAPALPATTLAYYCYSNMFYGCTSIKLSTTQTGNYIIPYRIPKEGTGTTATDALTDMFTFTSGTFTGTPEINTTYYLCGYGIERITDISIPAGSVFSFGTMSVTKDGVTTALTMPTNQVNKGDLYSYTTSSYANNIKDYYNATSITFGDSVDGKKLNWVKASDTLYICDRNLWNYISYDDLDALGYGDTDNTLVTIDGQTFKVRLLGGTYETDEEWDKYIVNGPDDSDDKWHWSSCFSWTSTLSSSSRVLRGFNSSDCSGSASPSARYNGYGFRPALEVVTP